MDGEAALSTVGVCNGDSGAPTFSMAEWSRSLLTPPSTVSADNRARVDSKEVRNWIKAQID